MQLKRWQLFFEIHLKTKLNKIRKYLCRMPFLTVWLKICCQIRLWFVSRDRTAKNRNLLHSFLKDIQRTCPAGIPAGCVSFSCQNDGVNCLQIVNSPKPPKTTPSVPQRLFSISGYGSRNSDFIKIMNMLDSGVIFCYNFHIRLQQIVQECKRRSEKVYGRTNYPPYPSGR